MRRKWVIVKTDEEGGKHYLLSGAGVRHLFNAPEYAERFLAGLGDGWDAYEVKEA